MNIDFEQERKQLLPRALTAHKGDFGHVGIIGAGYLAYGGAVCLAGNAALRAGAGKVSAFIHENALARMSGAFPELMCYTASDRGEGLDEFLEKVTVLVVGPGLGQAPWGREVLKKVLQQRCLLVLDADGLIILAESEPVAFPHWILTPHPGEAARLLGISVKEVQSNREQAIQHLQQKWGGVIILKGDHTLVCTQGEPVMSCPAGNPGMASGGMGDVLAGVIGALLAQGLTPWSAAKLGVMVHALGADKQSQKGQRGLLASDVLLECRALLN